MLDTSHSQLLQVSNTILVDEIEMENVVGNQKHVSTFSEVFI